MATFNTYQQANFPPVFKWQAVSFMRCEWPSIFQGELTFLTETYSPDLEPVHFVAAEGDVLLSYAAIIRLNIKQAGRPFTVYGFGNMFTFPPYRGKGYGRRVLDLATDYILKGDVDVSILFCEAKLAPFYALSGWQMTLAPTRIGRPDRYEPYENAIRMMLFVSAHGKGYRKAFEEQPVYVDWAW